jgi:hypothetical protein
VDPSTSVLSHRKMLLTPAIVTDAAPYWYSGVNTGIIVQRFAVQALTRWDRWSYLIAARRWINIPAARRCKRVVAPLHDPQASVVRGTHSRSPDTRKPSIIPDAAIGNKSVALSLHASARSMAQTQLSIDAA